MKPYLLLLIFLILGLTAIKIFWPGPALPTEPSSTAGPQIQNQTAPASTSNLVPPLSRSGERVTFKKFGQLVNDRFHGYHTGADFEIFPEETNQTVSVHAICAGILKLKEYVSGYGGVVVQDCQINNQAVTVVYGHLKLASVNLNTGDEVNLNQIIGILGAAYSQETDGERKHLHLGIHLGTSTNIAGYVSSPSELSSWLDPCQFVCRN